MILLLYSNFYNLLNDATFLQKNWKNLPRLATLWQRLEGSGKEDRDERRAGKRGERKNATIENGTCRLARGDRAWQGRVSCYRAKAVNRLSFAPCTLTTHLCGARTCVRRASCVVRTYAPLSCRTVIGRL